MPCLFPQRAFDEVFEIERKLPEKHRLNVAIAEYVSIDVGKVLKMFRMSTFADMKNNASWITNYQTKDWHLLE